jgi:hypothetical protein
MSDAVSTHRHVSTPIFFLFPFPNNPNHLRRSFFPPTLPQGLWLSIRLVEQGLQRISQENKCYRLAQIRMPLSLTMHSDCYVRFTMTKAKGLVCI